MRISVFGLGYVGCVTAAGLARAGHDVFGIDVDCEKVAQVASGASPIVEPGLDELVAAGVRSGRLKATVDSRRAIANSDLALVCVGTPSRPNGQLNTDALVNVSAEIGAALRDARRPYTVVVRSTVLPGTIDGLVTPAIRREAGPGAAIHVASNPEFMREGSSLHDFAHPPFTLVGAGAPEPIAQLRELYATVTDAPFIDTTITTAEMVKYVSNAFHAVKVAFANEIGDICEALGADAREVTRIFLADGKLNASGAYLKPGFAFGGSCLPKDLRALVHAARTHDVPAPLLQSVLPSNDAQVRRAVDAVLASRKKRVGIVGLAFKPGSDDLRESPFVAVVETLLGKGCRVRVLDRHLSIARLRGANRRFIEQEIPHLASLLCDDPVALVQDIDVLIVGHAGADAAAAVAAAGPEVTVVDLTRGGASRSPAAVAVRAAS
jgi:GDP-mannose 6-dehydrogenase